VPIQTVELDELTDEELDDELTDEELNERTGKSLTH